ncbi:MAG: cupin domain-containing protein [Thermomicrobiales bacterium]
MQSVNVNDLELQEVASAVDPTVLTRFTFPVYAATGAASTAVVYFELEPGNRLATHHDSPEEVLYIVQGEAIATVGDESAQVRAGDLAVIPAWVPHGIENTGRETLRVIGFFGASNVASLFTEPVFVGDSALAVLHTSDGGALYAANDLQPAGVA